MRNGQRGGRGGRVLGNNRAMGNDPLHRVRQNGNERINTHNRQGQRGRGGRMNPRNLQAGLAAGPQQWMMAQNGQPPNQSDLFAMLEHQNQMMFQLSQMMNGAPNGAANGGANGGGYARGRGGKSLFDRVQDPNRRQRKPHNGGQENGENTEGGEDMDMSGREPPNPDETICKYNLRCTNRECKFAHQSPAAPPGTAVDVNDPCSFGAACKNRKCVGRHPSPATKLAHQGEQDCKFFPNCHNPNCPFKHPSMPLCRNGAGCTTENCKFTHVKTKCKFNPCLNPHCAFTHEEGQQGGFKDKVWTPGGEHVSDRKFVDGGSEEMVKPDDEMKNDTNQTAEVNAQEDVIG